jgi:hypothetical protein
MSSGALVVVIVAVLAWPIAAASPTAKPEEVGFSTERLHRITELMQRHITAGDFSGRGDARRAQRTHRAPRGAGA